MKKIIALAMAASLTAVPAVSNAADEVKVKVDGKIITFPDAKPYVNEDSRTMVPVRFVTEALGCEVDWEEQEELVTISKETKRIVLKIGENSAIVNSPEEDAKKEFDTKTVLKDNRTMVPLRFISETLGAGVSWDAQTNTVIIRTDGTVEPEKKLQEVGGMTLEIAEKDPILSKLIKLSGASSISYVGTDKDTIRVGYGEYHKDGRIDRAMDVEFTPDYKHYFFHVFRDSEETRERLKNALVILFPDDSKMQETVYAEIIAYKGQKGYMGYYMDNGYYIMVKKISTTWTDEDPIAVWCTVKNFNR